MEEEKSSLKKEVDMQERTRFFVYTPLATVQELESFLPQNKLLKKTKYGARSAFVVNAIEVALKTRNKTVVAIDRAVFELFRLSRFAEYSNEQTMAFDFSNTIITTFLERLMSETTEAEIEELIQQIAASEIDVEALTRKVAELREQRAALIPTLPVRKSRPAKAKAEDIELSAETMDGLDIG